MMRRAMIAVLFATACTRERAKQVQEQDTLAQVSPDTMIVPPSGDTLPLYPAERDTLPLEPMNDATVTTRRAALAPVPGLPYGAAGLPIDSLCARARISFAVTVQQVWSNTPNDLAKVAACGGKIELRVARSALKNSRGCLDVPTATAHVRRWNWRALRPRITDRTILAIEVGDDIAHTEEWCGDRSVTLPKWDAIACAVRDSAPNVPIALRMLATQNTYRDRSGVLHYFVRPWKCITTVRAQFAGIRRHGRPNDFVTREQSSAITQGLGVIFGLNFLNAGCGRTIHCLPGVPGVSYGSGPDYEPSAKELVNYVPPMLRAARACGFAFWSWEYGTTFFRRTDIKASVAALADSARLRRTTVPTCKG